MNHSATQRKKMFPRIALLLLIVLGVAGAATYRRWLPWVQQMTATAARPSPTPPGNDDHGHDHGHDHAHDEANSLELSPQARRNLGLNAETVKAVQLKPFRRTITIPAVVAQRPGRTLIKVSTPLTGVVQHVHAVTGEAVSPDTTLFEIRLTHEDLVQTQTEFLQMLGELDVETREIKRLESIAETGAIAGKTLLERHYARDKLEAQLKAKREALKLHGLSTRQIQEIETTRHLLSELQIVAPAPDQHSQREELRLTGEDQHQVRVESSENGRGMFTTEARRHGENLFGTDSGQSLEASPEFDFALQSSQDNTLGSKFNTEVTVLSSKERDANFNSTPFLRASVVQFPPRRPTTSVAFQDHTHPPGEVVPPLMIEQLFAHKGQSVAAGEQLCTLADYHRLYLEGHAFEQDATAISRTAQNNWPISAIFDDGQERREVTGLKLSYVANSVDPQTRSLSFFVDLPNEVIRDETNAEGQRFITWKYRLGQRLQLLVPVEEWPSELVVPVDAVAREGAESYVFQKNGAHFDRVSVHVKYRDQQSVVIANDGSIKPGAVLALRSAHQMQMALKNKSGGGVDPHAGHNH
ncbi:efflux RND transporter periplasmic adaptor subunit [Planctomicrobium sp. SH661]|uniref:efflux RND transporter periplasmic adaptor subunit n=1 Tax=Planctomicrobium sp. SH661 TaxID=3448124 RepID=UPI003F5C5A73